MLLEPMMLVLMLVVPMLLEPMTLVPMLVVLMRLEPMLVSLSLGPLKQVGLRTVLLWHLGTGSCQ